MVAGIKVLATARMCKLVILREEDGSWTVSAVFFVLVTWLRAILRGVSANNEVYGYKLKQYLQIEYCHPSFVVVFAIFW